MYERLKQLKEDITSFIIDYDIEEFNTIIDYKEVQTVGGESYKTDKKVEIEIRM